MRYLSEPWGAIVLGAAVLGAVVFLWLVESNVASSRGVIDRMEAEIRSQDPCGDGTAPAYQNAEAAIWTCP